MNRYKGGIVMGLSVIVLIAISCRTAGQPSSECSADVRVYSPDGRPLTYSISSITLVNYPSIDLLKRPVEGLTTEAIGSGLRYSGRLPKGGRPEVRIELHGENGVVARRLVLPGCGSRVAVFRGVSGPELGTPEAEITGRLEGCDTFRGDWWTRLTPLFETWDATADALVRSDGSFRFFHFPAAVKHMLIVGRGSEIVAAKAIDFKVLPRIELAPIDVSSACK